MPKHYLIIFWDIIIKCEKNPGNQKMNQTTSKSIMKKMLNTIENNGNSTKPAKLYKKS